MSRSIACPRRAAASFLLLIPLALRLPAEDWTRFRGPNGSGVSTAGGFPVDLGDPRSVLWKSPVRPGKSSPVLTGRHIFVTAFQNGLLYTQCFDRATGKLLWERSEKRLRAEVIHKLNEPASATPVTDGENVYVFFRDIGLFSYNSRGKLRWKTPLGPFTNSDGLAASPIVAGRLVILVADQYVDGWIAAFNLDNGETQWRTPRHYYSGWATPLLRQSPSGDLEVITVAGGHFDAYSVATGKQTLSHLGLGPAVVPSPILEGDTVFALSYGLDTATPFDVPLGYVDRNGDGRIQADEIHGDAWLHQIAWYRGDRDGTITRDEWDATYRQLMLPSSLTALRLHQANPIDSTRELWRNQKSFFGVVPSPLLYQGVLYVVKNGGILTSFHPGTGEVLKTGRLRDAIESYFASPVAAEGRIYFVSEAGKVVVVEAGRDWRILSVGPLGEEAHATPALSQGRIFLRTAERLYCFASPAR